VTSLAAGSQHGTLYTALDRLREDELIGVDREEIVDNRLRRYYRLTPAGGALWFVELAVMLLLFSKQSSPYYRHQPVQQ
jgi:DNA-binding PadR family transcriptional regulator